MARQRHWVNRGGPCDCIFLTTAVLDFVHALARGEPRTAMRDAILAECRRSKAVLHAYVAVPHHVHLVARMPSDRGPTSFMHRLNLSASAKVQPLFEPDEAAQFSDQSGLNGNMFWQRSFRGKVVGSPGMFHRTIAYVHWHPVKAGLVRASSEYQWSSAKMWEDGLWDEEAGLRI